MCNEHNIKGYPTIQLYSNGQFIENYAQQRDFDVMSAYIIAAAEEHASPASNIPNQNLADIGVNPIGKVTQLTAETFDSQVARSKEPWILQMYTPWCKYCSQLATVWDQLATELKGHVNVASINCESSKGKWTFQCLWLCFVLGQMLINNFALDAKALCLKQGVTGYPTIKL